MAQCLLLHGWLVLLKTGACGGLPIFFEVTTNWRAGCQKLACPVRREGRPESSSLPLSCHTLRKRVENGPRRIAPTAHFEPNDVTIRCETVHQGFFAEMESIRPHSGSNPRLLIPAFFVRLFTFHGHPAPDARERIPAPGKWLGPITSTVHTDESTLTRNSHTPTRRQLYKQTPTGSILGKIGDGLPI